MKAMNSTQKLKIQLRKRLDRKVRAISSQARQKKNKAILIRTMRLIDSRKPDKVFLYASFRGEVDTKALIRKCFERGIKVYLPKVQWKSKQLAIKRINSSRDLKRGAFGIFEPKTKCPQLRNLNLIDLAVIPGLGFDRSGGRLGRGQGYYDCVLKKLKKAYRVGIAFREQCVKKIPRVSWDVKMHKVITD